VVAIIGRAYNVSQGGFVSRSGLPRSRSADLESAYESLQRAVLVKDQQWKVRLGHPHTADLNCGGHGHCGENVDHGLLTVSGLDGVEDGPLRGDKQDELAASIRMDDAGVSRRAGVARP